MYSSNLMFQTIPGKTGELENRIARMLRLVEDAGGQNARILHTHFASPDGPDVVFVQDVADLAILEKQIHQITTDSRSQQWTKKLSHCSGSAEPRELFGSGRWEAPNRVC
ncbi:MAG TPA: hypothetical protein VFX54_02040 [Candidatus Binatia bacterium]|nr:hypothetical protein [Candidatus Binatia bacterium]